MEKRAHIFAGVIESGAVIKITGHATFAEAANLKKYEDQHAEQHLNAPQLIFDLTECVHVDSTMIGIIANLAVKYYKKNGKKKAIVLYANSMIQNILDTNNCQFILDPVLASPGEVSKAGATEEIMASTESGGMFLRQSILLAHETLIELNEDNLAKFSSLVSQIRKKISQ